MGQIIGGAAKPKRCNLSKLSQLGTPDAGEYILVSSDNSMNAAGNGCFDCYIKGNGNTVATLLPLKTIDTLPRDAADCISYIRQNGGNSIEFLDDNDNIVGTIDDNGLDFTSVKVNGVDVVATEKISTGTSTSDKNIVITDNNNNIVGTIDEDGIDFVGVKVNGVDVMTTETMPELNHIVDGGTTNENKIVITDNNDNDILSIDSLGVHATELFIDDKPVSPLLDGVSISLPDKIYAVVGDTLQLFYHGIIVAKNVYQYDILISCSKGKQCRRYFEYTPTAGDVGSTSFMIQVKNNERKVLAEKTCTLVTVGAGQSPSSQKNVLCFGDSLTVDGHWCAEAFRRLIASGGSPAGDNLSNISFVGSMIKSGAGYFGKGGWKWSDYTTEGRPAFRFYVTGVSSLSVGAVYTNNGHSYTIAEVNVTNGTGNILCAVSSSTDTPTASGTLTKSSGNGDATISFSSYEANSQNPLWDYTNSVMTFIPYANTYCNSQIDVVCTLLTMNGQTAGRTDFSSMIADVKTFADTLHSEFPNAKLKLMGCVLPSINGGMGANYGATGYSYADEYGMAITVFNMNKAYQNFANQAEYSAFVEFVNVCAEFDTEYNMPHTEKSVNTRNTMTEMVDTNGLHPSQSGYMQIADVIYRNLIAEFCQ